MAKSKLSIFGYVILILFVLLVTFIFGVFTGSYQSMLRDGAPNAAITLSELKLLRSGKVDKLIQVKEIELDNHIFVALKYQKEGYKWIFFPFNSAGDEYDKFLRAVAQYRKTYPPLTNFEGGEEDSSYKIQVESQTKLLLEQYGK